MREEIERIRGELGRAIERKESPVILLSLSVKLDQLIEEYLESQEKNGKS